MTQLYFTSSPKMLTSTGSIKHNSVPRGACWFLGYGVIAHELQKAIALGMLIKNIKLIYYN